MTSGDVNSKRAAPDDTWLAAPSLSDPNAALWHSLRPTGRPSWLVSLRRHVESFSLLNPVRHLLPSSWQSGGGASRWVFVGALTVCAGAGLSILGRAVVAPSHDATPAAESRTPSGAAAAGAVPASNARTRLGATEFGVPGLDAPRAAVPVPADATVIHSLSPSDLALAPADPTAKAKSASSAKKKARAAARRRAARNRRNAGLSATLP